MSEQPMTREQPVAAEEVARLRARVAELETLWDRTAADRDHWRRRYRTESRTTWSTEVPPGGEVCADCGEPVESEPCREHNPAAVAEQLRARVAELELAYIGKEPTIAQEMDYLSRCLNAVHDLCDEAEKQASRWESPLPVPEWVDAVRKAADGDRPDDPADDRHRIYIDGKGNGWISVCSEGGVEYVVPVQPAALVEQALDEVAAEAGGLREIGRCW